MHAAYRMPSTERCHYDRNNSREGNRSCLLISARLLDFVNRGFWVLAPSFLQRSDLGQAQMASAQDLLHRTNVQRFTRAGKRPQAVMKITRLPLQPPLQNAWMWHADEAFCVFASAYERERQSCRLLPGEGRMIFHGAKRVQYLV